MADIRNVRKAMLALALASGIALAGCSSGIQTTTSTDEDAGGMPKDLVVYDKVANPITEVGTAQEAAEGAGLDTFEVPDSVTVDGKTISSPKFMFIDTDIAEALYEGDDGRVVIRKGHPLKGEDSIAGDYGTYEEHWILDADGREVTCNGHEEGKALLVEWKDADGVSFSIASYADDYDTDIPMTDANVTDIVKGIN